MSFAQTTLSILLALMVHDVLGLFLARNHDDFDDNGYA